MDALDEESLAVDHTAPVSTETYHFLPQPGDLTRLDTVSFLLSFFLSISKLALRRGHYSDTLGAERLTEVFMAFCLFRQGMDSFGSGTGVRQMPSQPRLEGESIYVMYFHLRALLAFTPALPHSYQSINQINQSSSSLTYNPPILSYIHHHHHHLSPHCNTQRSNIPLSSRLSPFLSFIFAHISQQLSNLHSFTRSFLSIFVLILIACVLRIAYSVSSTPYRILSTLYSLRTDGWTDGRMDGWRL